MFSLISTMLIAQMSSSVTVTPSQPKQQKLCQPSQQKPISTQNYQYSINSNTQNNPYYRPPVQSNISQSTITTQNNCKSK